jgi:hypothetical protein
MSEPQVDASHVEETVTQVLTQPVQDVSLMNNITIKSHNRMNTDILDDRMMICSNGPAVSAQKNKEIDVIVDLAFEHWSHVQECRHGATQAS